MKLDTTPWARAVLDDETTDAIRKADPRDALMHVGRGPSQWRAVVTWNGRVLAEVRRDRIGDAVRGALERV